MRGVILQPNYLPWRGYFDLIKTADIFVFLDDVQYTKRDWRNRNKIKTKDGIKWLTVPVKLKSNRDLINKVEIVSGDKWKNEHLNMIRHAYGKAPYFSTYFELLRNILLQDWRYLAELDICLIKTVSDFLSISQSTKFVCSSVLGVSGVKEDRLISICRATGIKLYISGPSGANYINEKKFSIENVELEYFQYDYPEYPQLNGGFVDGLSIIDLLFNCGEKSSQFIWGKTQN